MIETCITTLRRRDRLPRLRNRLHREHPGRRIADGGRWLSRNADRVIHHQGAVQLVALQQPRRGGGERRVPAVPQRRHRDHRPRLARRAARRGAAAGSRGRRAAPLISRSARPARRHVLSPRSARPATPSATRREDDPGYFGLALTQRNVIAVTGACLMTRRDTFEALGGFDEAHSIVNNDLDYCLRAWQSGWLTVYTPHATLVHHEAISRAALEDDYDAAVFDGKWRDLFLAGDPFFNPHLSKDHDDFAIDARADPAVGHRPADRCGATKSARSSSSSSIISATASSRFPRSAGSSSIFPMPASRC